MISQNHPFLQMAEDIDQICNPLKKFGVHLFSYRKTFADGSRVNLSNNANWLDDYYNLDLFKSSLFEYDIENYATGFSLWPQESALPIFSHGRMRYNSDNGITLTLKQPDFCEFFIFGADKNNKQMLNIYINNLELIKNFTDYFHAETTRLMKEAEQSLIQIQLKNSENQTFENIYNCDFSEIKQLFKITKPTEKDILLAKLSPREIDCVELILQGKTAKEIARHLNLSYRTVEFYLNNLRQKTGSRNKFELIKLFS